MITAGTRITTRVEFRQARTPENPNPALEDPTTTTLRVSDDTGATTDYVFGTDEEVQRVAEGIFTGSFTVQPDGKWSWSWIATGTVEVVTDPVEITVHAGLPAPV